MTRVFVVGLPRSGTTWVARVLEVATGAEYLEEPDNHFRRAYAFRAKNRLRAGEYPLLRAGDEPGEVEDYATLWREAFAPLPSSKGERARRRASSALVRLAGPGRVSSTLAGRRRTPLLLATASAIAVPERAPRASSGLIVKSVHAPLSAEWVVARNPAHVVVVLRNPLNVLASWLELEWVGGDAFESLATLHPLAAESLASRLELPRPDVRSRLAGAAWLVGALTCALEADVRRHGWARMVHEQLCLDPRLGFSGLAYELGATWSSAGDHVLEQMDRPGSGYELARVASELPEAWRKRLGEEHVREILQVLESFPLPDDLRLAPGARS